MHAGGAGNAARSTGPAGPRSGPAGSQPPANPAVGGPYENPLAKTLYGLCCVLTAVAVALGLERVSGLTVGSVTTDLFLAFGFCAIYTGWKLYELWTEPRGSMICPKCGHENPPALIFCEARRRRLLVFVSYCAAVLYPAAFDVQTAAPSNRKTPDTAAGAELRREEGADDEGTKTVGQG